MYSEMPELIWGKKWAKNNYCEKKVCQEMKTFEVLKGPEELPPVTQDDIDALFDAIMKARKDKAL